MEIIKGDLLKALATGDIDVLAHGTNCSNGFGSGVARQIKEQYPLVKEMFHDHYAASKGLTRKDIVTGGYLRPSSAQLGTIDPVLTRDGFIINCYTQLTYGSRASEGALYLNYDALNSCMDNLSRFANTNNFTVGLPKIGCGLAGGDWKVVKSIIKSNFKKNKAEYKVYVL